MLVSRKNKIFVVLAIAVLSLTQIGTAATKPVTITMIRFDRDQEAKWQEAVLEQFHEEQDQIQVELVSSAGTGNAVTKAYTMAMAGMPLHIGYADPIDTIGWGVQGLTMDLEPFFQRDAKKAPFKDFFDGMLSMHTAQGKRYAIPEDLQVQAFFYNQEHFDEAGLAYPNASWIWDTVAKIAPRLAKDANGDGIPERWAMRDPQWLHWWSVFWAFGGEFVDDAKLPTKFTGDSEPMQQGFRWFHRMIQELRVMPPIGGIKGSTATNMVAEQSISMAIGNSLYMQEALSLGNKVKWDVVPLPKGPAGNQAYTNAIGWAIFNHVPNQQQAWEVIKYFSSEKAMRLAVEMRGTLVPHLPTSKYLWSKRYDFPPSRMVFVDAVDTAKPLPTIYGDGLSAIRTNMNSYLAGQVSLSQALESMKIRVNTWIGTLKR